MKSLGLVLAYAYSVNAAYETITVSNGLIYKVPVAHGLAYRVHSDSLTSLLEKNGFENKGNRVVPVCDVLGDSLTCACFLKTTKHSEGSKSCSKAGTYKDGMCLLYVDNQGRCISVPEPPVMPPGWLNSFIPGYIPQISLDMGTVHLVQMDSPKSYFITVNDIAYEPRCTSTAEAECVCHLRRPPQMVGCLSFEGFKATNGQCYLFVGKTPGGIESKEGKKSCYPMNPKILFLENGKDLKSHLGRIRGSKDLDSEDLIRPRGSRDSIDDFMLDMSPPPLDHLADLEFTPDIIFPESKAEYLLDHDFPIPIEGSDKGTGVLSSSVAPSLHFSGTPKSPMAKVHVRHPSRTGSESDA